MNALVKVMRWHLLSRLRFGCLTLHLGLGQVMAVVCRRGITWTVKRCSLRPPIPFLSLPALLSTIRGTSMVSGFCTVRRLGSSGV